MAAQRIEAAAKSALIAAIVLTLLAVAADSSGVTLAVAPIVALLVIFVMSRVPLRYSLVVLTFFAFTLENPDEVPAMGLWHSPFSTLGAIMLTHLNAVDRSMKAISWAAFSGMDLCIVTLFLIAWQRKSSRSKIDGGNRVATPKPLMQVNYISLGAIAFIWMAGLAQGGDFGMSLWQVNRVVYLPLLFFLYQTGLRGPQDNAMLARCVLYAATLRAVMAFYIKHTVDAPLDEAGNSTLVYATSHADSMLFATAVVVCVSLLLERVPRTLKRNCVILLGIICLGIMANGRRMAWVQVAIVLLTVYQRSADNPIKRRIRRILPYALGVFTMYAAVGWGSKSPLFKPVQMVQSIVQPQTDASSLWREIENYDIINTFRMNPIFGSGYGRPYVEFIHLDEVSYPLEHFAPHNSILGLWCFCGYVGYTGLTLAWAVGVYFAMRAQRAAKEPFQRVAAIASFGGVLIYLVQCWGDVGLGSWTGVFIAAPALATAGKLAVANGEWGSKKARDAAGATRTPSPSGMPAPEQAV